MYDRCTLELWCAQPHSTVQCGRGDDALMTGVSIDPLLPHLLLRFQYELSEADAPKQVIFAMSLLLLEKGNLLRQLPPGSPYQSSSHCDTCADVQVFKFIRSRTNVYISSQFPLDFTIHLWGSHHSKKLIAMLDVLIPCVPCLRSLVFQDNVWTIAFSVEIRKSRISCPILVSPYCSNSDYAVPGRADGTRQCTARLRTYEPIVVLVHPLN